MVKRKSAGQKRGVGHKTAQRSPKKKSAKKTMHNPPSSLFGSDPNKKDTDGDTVPDDEESCPNDPDKTEPGICGCGLPDLDTDGDGIYDCHDNCPLDPIEKGDINNDCIRDLKDAILALQCACFILDPNLFTEADINGDGLIGLAEALFALLDAAY